MSKSLAAKSLILFVVATILTIFIVNPLLYPDRQYPYAPDPYGGMRAILGLLLLFVPPVVGVIYATQSLARKEGKTALAIVGLVLNVLFVLFGLFGLFATA